MIGCLAFAFKNPGQREVAGGVGETEHHLIIAEVGGSVHGGGGSLHETWEQ